MRSTALILTFVCAFTLGCSSTSSRSAHLDSSTTYQENFPDLIKRYSVETKQYDGFNQTFGANVTLLNTEVNYAVLQRRAIFLGWDEERIRQEREKSFQEASAYSQVFLAFYAPDDDYDDLNKPNSIWRAYLETNGQRYEGKIKKSTMKLAEVRELFPYMDRFRTPYIITFEVPMTAVETSTSVLTLTSSLGTANFQFPPVGSK